MVGIHGTAPNRWRARDLNFCFFLSLLLPSSFLLLLHTTYFLPVRYRGYSSHGIGTVPTDSADMVRGGHGFTKRANSIPLRTYPPQEHFM